MKTVSPVIVAVRSSRRHSQEVTTMNLGRIAIYAAAGLALLFGWRVVYNPNLSMRAEGQVTFLSLSPQSVYSSKVAKKLLVPGSLPEEPEWLSEAQNDPDPRIRLNAIETWARSPTESLDPITYSLLDPDESVRAEAQKLLQDTLARAQLRTQN
jgi:hypothetical protein